MRELMMIYRGTTILVRLTVTVIHLLCLSIVSLFSRFIVWQPYLFGSARRQSFKKMFSSNCFFFSFEDGPALASEWPTREGLWHSVSGGSAWLLEGISAEQYDGRPVESSKLPPYLPLTFETFFNITFVRKKKENLFFSLHHLCYSVVQKIRYFYTFS